MDRSVTKDLQIEIDGQHIEDMFLKAYSTLSSIIESY